MRSASSRGVLAFIHKLEQDWRLFASARPGHRFCAYHRRARERGSRVGSIVRICIGVALCAGGVVLWFLPGPGWLLIFFGMALFAGESSRLARRLDDLELALRDRARRLLAWWRRRDRVRS